VSRLTHLVLVRPKPGVGVEDFAEVERAFAAMVGVIDGLEEVRCGPNVSPEGLNRDFAWAAVMRLRDVDARDGYLPHEAHSAAAAKLQPVASEVLVFDLASAW
jgi:Stress responsive A/B Barrel Domain